MYFTVQFKVLFPGYFLLYTSCQEHLKEKYVHFIQFPSAINYYHIRIICDKLVRVHPKRLNQLIEVSDHNTKSSFSTQSLFFILALRRLRGCDVQNCELDEILQEQAETKGMRPRRPWELFADRSVRWQLISVMIISSAMQLCGNDSVRRASINVLSVHIGKNVI